MTKEGHRPITLPQHKGRDYQPGPTARFSNRRGYKEDDSAMELTASIHIEQGSYCADVPDRFASGDTLDELFESLRESVALYLADEGEQKGPLHVAAATLTDQPLTAA